MQDYYTTPLSYYQRCVVDHRVSLLIIMLCVGSEPKDVKISVHTHQYQEVAEFVKFCFKKIVRRTLSVSPPDARSQLALAQIAIIKTATEIVLLLVREQSCPILSNPYIPNISAPCEREGGTR